MYRKNDEKFIHGALTNEENSRHDMEKQFLSFGNIFKFFFNRPGLQEQWTRAIQRKGVLRRQNIFQFHQFPDCSEDFSLCIEKATSFILDRESLIHSNSGISYSLHYNDLLSEICH